MLKRLKNNHGSTTTVWAFFIIILIFFMAIILIDYGRMHQVRRESNDALQFAVQSAISQQNTVGGLDVGKASKLAADEYWKLTSDKEIYRRGIVAGGSKCLRSRAGPYPKIRVAFDRFRTAGVSSTSAVIGKLYNITTLANQSTSLKHKWKTISMEVTDVVERDMGIFGPSCIEFTVEASAITSGAHDNR